MTLTPWAVGSVRLSGGSEARLDGEPGPDVTAVLLFLDAARSPALRRGAGFLRESPLPLGRGVRAERRTAGCRLRTREGRALVRLGRPGPPPLGQQRGGSESGDSRLLP